MQKNTSILSGGLFQVALSVFILVQIQSSASDGADAAIATEASLAAVGYSTYWSIDLPASSDRMLAADLVDENLYVVTQSGGVYTVHADTGLIRWVQPLADTIIRHRPPSHVVTSVGDGPVVFVTHNTINVFDRYNGDLLRELKLPFAAGGGAVADWRRLFVGSASGEMYAVNWSADFSREFLVAWHAGVRGAVMSAPVLAFDRLYFASDRGGVYCVRPEDKSLVWGYVAEGDIAGGVYVDESGVYFASSDRHLSVLDVDTGEQIVRYGLPGPLFDSPVGVQRTIYQYCEGDGVFAFDTDTRSELWLVANARRYVARSANDVVLESVDGDLLFVDNVSGRVRGTIEMASQTIVVENTRDSVLYLISPGGRVLCAKPKGFPYLRRDAVLRERAQLRLSPAELRARERELLAPSPSVGGGGHVSDPDPFRSRS
jgi:putative pyrroloquinoline-quinone binding quinoprotein